MIKRNKILFSVILLLSSVFYAYANDAGNSEYQIQFQKSLDREGGNDISLSFYVKYGSTCGSFRAELLLPNFIIATNAEVSQEVFNGLQPVFNSTSMAGAPEGFRKYIITFTPTEGALNGSSAEFTINKFASNHVSENPCTWKTEKGILKVGIIPESCNGISQIQYNECSANVTPPTIKPSRITIDTIRSYYSELSNEAPYKLIVSVNHYNPNTDNYTSALNSLTLNVPAGLECIGVTRMTSDYYKFYNQRNISVNGSSIVITGSDILADYGTSYYSFYFKKNESGNTGNYNIGVTVSYEGGIKCNNGSTSTQPFSENRIFSISGAKIPSNVNKPFVDARPSSLNINNCNPVSNSSAYFPVEVDLSFAGGKVGFLSPTDTLFYEMTLNSTDIGIKQMTLPYTDYVIPLQGKVLYYYKVKNGQQWVSFTLSNNSKVFETNNNIEKILVKFYGINTLDYFSRHFRYEYFMKQQPVGNQSYSYSVELYKKNGENKTILSERQNVSLTMSSTECPPVPKYYNVSNKFLNNENVQLGAVEMNYNKYKTIYPAMLWVGSINNDNTIFSAGNLTEFTYTLSDKLKFVIDEATQKIDIKYYCTQWQPTGVPEHLLQKLDDNFYEIINDGSIKFKNLNNVPGIAEQTYFYVVYEVKLREDAKATHGNNPYIMSGFQESSNNWQMYDWYRSTFSIQGSRIFSTYMYAVCDETQFTNKVSLTNHAGEQYMYKFVVDNYGNEAFNNVAMVGSLPYPGDKKVLNDNVDRNSDFLIPLTKDDAVKIYRLNSDNEIMGEPLYNGTINGLLNNPDWELKFTTTANPCLKDVLNVEDKSTCNEPVWTNTVPSGAAYFMLRSLKGKESDPMLKMFSKLVVSMKGNLPGSLSVGQEASASFAAQGDNFIAKENERLATIVIAEERNCTPGITKITLDPCRTYSIRYELPEICAGDKAKLEWSTPRDNTRRLISTCNLTYGDECAGSSDPEDDDPCGLKNNLPAQADICEKGQTLKLDAFTKNAGSYKWLPNHETTSSIVVKDPGVYTVTITHQNTQCPSVTQSVTVGSVDEACLATSTGPDAVLNPCRGDAVRLDVPKCGASYRWSPTDYLSDPAVADPMASPPSSTSYNVVITTAGGCKFNKTVYVNVNPPFELKNNNGDNILGCRGQQITLDISGAEGYRWSPKYGLSCYDCANPQHTITGNMTYEVTGMKDGCLATKEIEISQHPDDIFFEYKKNGCYVEFWTDEEQYFKDYAWTFGDGNIGNGRNATHNYRESGHGTYSITVEATNACGVRISRTIPVTITSEECSCAPKCK